MAKLAVAAAIVVGSVCGGGGGRAGSGDESRSVAVTASSASHIDLRRDYAQTRASRSQPIKLVTPTTLARPPTRTYASIGQENQLMGDPLLSRIMQCESHSNPVAQNPHSTASGLFQVLDSTWGRWGGFARAMDAPSDVQWAQARALYARSGSSPWNASKACWS